MILSIPVAEVNTVIFSHGVLLSRIDRLDSHTMESFQHLCHKCGSFNEVAIGHNPSSFLTAMLLLLMIFDKFLVSLHEALKEVDEARKCLTTILVLYVWHWYGVVFLRHVVPKNALNL